MKTIQKKPPLVSVIIPTYNRPEMLAGAIQSVLNQTYDNYEIIVINDCGVTVENIVSSLNENGKILYIKHCSNKGISATRNTGIRNAMGKYIAYLDDDDIFYPNHIEILLSHLETTNSKVAYTDAHKAIQVWSKDSYFTAEKIVSYSRDFDYNRILIENFIPAPCVMHRKECFDNVNMFDENLLRLEDWDLWIRMSRSYKFDHIKQTTCEYRWRDDGTSMMTGSQILFDWAFLNMFHKYTDFVKGKSKIIRIQRDIINEAFRRLQETAKISFCSNEENPHKIFCGNQLQNTISTLIFFREKYPHNIVAINSIIELLKNKKISINHANERDKEAPSLNEIQHEHERKIKQDNDKYIEDLQNKIMTLQRRVLDLDKTIRDIQGSRGWQLLRKYYELRDSIIARIRKQ